MINVMNPEQSERTADDEQLKAIETYVDSIDGWSLHEKEILKNNLKYLPMREKVLEIMHIAAENDLEKNHRILLEALRSDLRDFTE